MKIEIGESIMYSWMRHVKNCKIVQTNWKASTLWKHIHDNEVEKYIHEFSDLFRCEKNFDVFKQNASSEQIIAQGECDVIGVDFSENNKKIYAADVAFHRNGLNYKDTVQKVVEKCIRTALCLYMFTNMKDAEIVFASPKIGQTNLDKIIDCIKLVQKKFDEWNFNYKFDIISNNDFLDKILEPVCLVSDMVDDTNELFLRSYQLIDMFYGIQNNSIKKTINPRRAAESTQVPTPSFMPEYKIGKLAQTWFNKLANDGRISPEDVLNLLDKEYSHDNLGLNFPCLVKDSTTFERRRYYKDAILVNGRYYHLCSQWSETRGNNDRPFLENWIRARL